jgi:uncharacterized protein YndB with AHSA1/START domain
MLNAPRVRPTTLGYDHAMTDITTSHRIDIAAPPERVWEALTTPEQISRWFFGVETESDWQVGRSLVHRGQYQGQPYEDRGEILELDPPKRFVHTHWSPMSGLPDTPEHAQRVTWSLEPSAGGTTLIVAEDNLPSEQAKTISDQSWPQALDGLRALLER